MDEKQLKEAYAALVKDRSNRDALAALITEFVKPGHITTDFVGMLLNTRNLNPGDALVKKVRKGIEVHTLVPGSIHLRNEITVTERVNYVLDGADVGVQWNQWEMEAGELGTLAEIRAEVAAKLRDYYMNKVFTALTTVWTAANTPNNYVSVGGNLTSAVLKTAIDRINQTTGGVKAVVGIRALLTPVTTFGGFWADSGATLHRVDSQLEEIMRTGWLGKFYGAPIVALTQEYNNPDDYTALLPTTKVLVIGENVGEFITFGEVKTKMWDDNRPTPPYTNYEIYQQFGMMIDNAQGIYVIDNLT